MKPSTEPPQAVIKAHYLALYLDLIGILQSIPYIWGLLQPNEPHEPVDHRPLIGPYSSTKPQIRPISASTEPISSPFEPQGVIRISANLQS